MTVGVEKDAKNDFYNYVWFILHTENNLIALHCEIVFSAEYDKIANAIIIIDGKPFSKDRKIM